jgi:hypothetical protein
MSKITIFNGARDTINAQWTKLNTEIELLENILNVVTEYALT